ncbi:MULTISPECIES: PH domain-containing protein [Mesobacillus]|uniref:Membrane protein n=2 Tax=Mesobacillus TaxID=2675231 RepID=A0A0D6ZDV1_9BACI|nr:MULTISPECIES: PH domain-containing protein [Mesobacillus]KIY22753.1 membrane protein [Mesobacillus subterraneus]MDQ0415034.1 membrane protein YdbS with pleckstrin-like domain [Mesobacillus stamsii]
MTISEPQKRISRRALTVWKIAAGLHSLMVWILAGSLVAVAIIFNLQKSIIGAAVAVAVIYSYLFIFLVPQMRWKRWRYEVREQEIELQYGVFIVKRTLIPMIRVQHVDTLQGPLLRKYQLATVTVSTAATVHEIPALDMEEAESLRMSISRLARVADEDV